MMISGGKTRQGKADDAGPPPISIVSVTDAGNGTDVIVLFSGPATFNGNLLGLDTFDLDGSIVPNGGAQSNANTIVITFPSASAAPGVQWVLKSQPEWLNETIAVPEGGVLL